MSTKTGTRMLVFPTNIITHLNLPATVPHEIVHFRIVITVTVVSFALTQCPALLTTAEVALVPLIGILG